LIEKQLTFRPGVYCEFHSEGSPSIFFIQPILSYSRPWQNGYFNFQQIGPCAAGCRAKVPGCHAESWIRDPSPAECSRTPAVNTPFR